MCVKEISINVEKEKGNFLAFAIVAIAITIFWCGIIVLVANSFFGREWSIIGALWKALLGELTFLILALSSAVDNAY